MEKKVKTSRLAGVPAWALSLLTLVATIICVVILSDLDMKRELAGQAKISIGTIKLSLIIQFIVFVILIPFVCFFICRMHPKSVWYAPIICNAVGFGAFFFCIYDSIFNPGHTTFTDWIIWGGSSVLAVTGAIIGAKIGRRRIEQEN